MNSKTGKNSRVHFLTACLLVLVTTAVYLQARNHDFIGYDDDWYVTENVHVTSGLTRQNIAWAFSSAALGNWHPVTWLSHQLDVQLFGMRPGAHHLVNVFLHVLNTLLLCIVLQRMTGEWWKSLLVAALFAIHPLHVESVAWIAERKDVLSAFFWMLTMLCYVLYVEKVNRSMYLLMHLVFGLGLLSKPMVVTLPFILLLLDYWPLKRFQGRQSSGVFDIYDHRRLMWPSLVKEKLGLFILALSTSLVTFFSQSGSGNIGGLQTYPLTIRASNALVSYASYMAKMIWPTKLAVLYPHPGMPPFGKLMGALCILSVMTFLAIKYASKYPWLGVGWLWYLGALVPVIGIVQVGVQAMADRYTYIPLIGLFIVIVWGTPLLLPKNFPRKRVLFPLSTALILLLSTASWLQVRHWSNSILLFQHTIEVTDDNYIMHNNLGLALQANGKTTEALHHYGEAIRIKPEFVEAHLNVGVVLTDLGKYEAAAEKYVEVLRIDPNYVQAHLNLGNNMLRQGYGGEAAGHYAKVLALDPESADAYNGLGAAMVLIGQYEKACLYFKKALHLNSGHAAARENLNRIAGRLQSCQEKISFEP